MQTRILRILLKKELTLMLRNPLIPRLIVAMPLLVMLVIPLVADLDVKDVGVAVVDRDHSLLSRRLVADMDASASLTVTAVCDTYDEALRHIERGDADVVLTIPSGYFRDLSGGKSPLGAQYASRALLQTLARWSAEEGTALPEAAAASILNRYNPTLNFRNYMIPALMVVLLILICGFLPALNLVSEKESGTIEAMNVTPVGRFTFVLSKLIPFWAVGLLVVTVGMLVGWLVYGLVPAGHIAYIYLAAILFTLVMSGLGVSIANRSSTLLQSIFVMFAFIVIFQLMGGLFTPIASMPRWAQVLTYAIPPRYFIEIMRAVYLKGAGIADLWQQYAALAAFALLFCLVAAKTYRKRE